MARSSQSAALRLDLSPRLSVACDAMRPVSLSGGSPIVVHRWELCCPDFRHAPGLGPLGCRHAMACLLYWAVVAHAEEASAVGSAATLSRLRAGSVLKGERCKKCQGRTIRMFRAGREAAAVDAGYGWSCWLSARALAAHGRSRRDGLRGGRRDAAEPRSGGTARELVEGIGRRCSATVRLRATRRSERRKPIIST